MCEAPERSWAEAVRPLRVVLGIAAIGSIVVGIWLLGVVGAALIAIGAALLISAVVLPTVRQVEFGFPVGVKVVTATQDREDELREAFLDQKADLELCAQMMVDDPDVARQLLEAAIAKTTVAWRGPVSPALRIYVLCELVHLVTTHDRWSTHGPTDTTPGSTALAALPSTERIVVVLREFGGLPVAQIATMTGRDRADLESALRHGEDILAKTGSAGGAGP